MRGELTRLLGERDHVAGACACWGLDNHLTALIDGITPARSTLVKGAVAGATNLAIGGLTDS